MSPRAAKKYTVAAPWKTPESDCRRQRLIMSVVCGSMSHLEAPSSRPSSGTSKILATSRWWPSRSPVRQRSGASARIRTSGRTTRGRRRHSGLGGLLGGADSTVDDLYRVGQGGNELTAGILRAMAPHLGRTRGTTCGLISTDQGWSWQAGPLACRAYCRWMCP